MDPSSELAGVMGFHPVTKEQARELIQPYLATDGYYLLRPSSDVHGTVLCTICVTNRQKLMNYRLQKDRNTGRYFIHNHTPFTQILQLIEYYCSNPINADNNTRLLSPVLSKQQQQQRQQRQEQQEEGPSSEDHYVVMQRPNSAVGPTPAPVSKDPPTNTTTNSTNRSGSADTSNGSDLGEIPGLHVFLPKAEIQNVMQPYLSSNGSYLLRPSSTSKGQLTLAVSHDGKVLNFKIAVANDQYYITPKRRFSSVQELLTVYRSFPIRSKRSSQEVYLLTPIPVDPLQERQFEMRMEEKALKQNQPEPLPHPWQEYWHEQFRRAYYYNPTSGQSVWERPAAEKTRSMTTPNLPGSPRNTKRIQDRPLPSTPEVGTASVAAASRKATPSPVVNRRKGQSLPALPDKDSIPPELPPPRGASTKRPPRVSLAERELPPLPPKDTSTETPTRRGLPPRDTATEAPTRRGPPPRDTATETPTRRGPPPRDTATETPTRRGPPPRETSFETPTRRGLPPLPPKEQDTPLHTSGRETTNSIPQLPPKEPEVDRRPLPPRAPERELPPLPPKEDRSLPPLPPKTSEGPEVPVSSLIPPLVQPPTGRRRAKRKVVVEYEDHVLLHQVNSNSSSIKTPPLPDKGPTPPLPDKGPAPPLPDKGPTPPLPDKGPVPPLPDKGPAPPLPDKGPAPPLPNKGPAPPLPDKTPSGAVPPPPPPPIPANVPAPPPVASTPAPPPPPPSLPPPSPLVPHITKSRPAPSDSPGTARPFTATDLSHARTLLKKSENSPDLRRSTVGGGLADVFANAIDHRMNSIRRAVTDSDEESEFEDVDDDWD